MPMYDTFSKHSDFAKCGKNDPSYDKFSLKQGQLLSPEVPKRGVVKKFPCLTPPYKNWGSNPPPRVFTLWQTENEKKIKSEGFFSLLDNHILNIFTENLLIVRKKLWLFFQIYHGENAERSVLFSEITLPHQRTPPTKKYTEGSPG